MNIGVSPWGGCGMVNMYVNLELLFFYLSIYLFLFVHNRCERTDGIITMKFGMSSWSGCGMVST